MTRSDIVKKWQDDGSDIHEAINIIKTFTGEEYDSSRLLQFKYRLKVLSAIESFSDDNTIVNPSSKKTTTTYADKERASIQEIPEEVLICQLKRKKLFKLQAQAHAILKLDTTDQQRRYELAWSIIVDYIPEISRLSNVLNRWRHNGEIPSIEKSNLIQEINEKHARIKYITEKSSRLRSQMKKASQVEKSKLQNELDEMEEEREILKEELQLK